jgi:methyl-accepting chemotaxis protein
MRLNIYNNFRAIYYNTLANFYLCFNSVVPYYDDVILSLSITSFKNILNNNNLCLRTIKQNRLVQLLYSLNDKDNLILDDDGFIIIDYAENDVHTENIDISDNTDTENDVDNADAVANTDEVVENTDEVVANTDKVVENTDEVVENTDKVVENTDEVVVNTDEVVENTDEVVENTDEVVENTVNVVENTDEVVENTDEDKEIKYNILDKKNN